MAANAKRLVELSMVPALATEVAKQIDDNSSSGSVAWGDVTGKPATFAPIVGNTATTALAGNTALLTIGTTATTAKAGNYAPAWGDVTGKPATFPPAIGSTATTALAGNTPLLAIGTTATTAKAGNAVQTATQTTATAIAPGTATNVQGILAELAARITALEA